MTATLLLSSYTTPDDAADYYGMSRRAVRDMVRKLGCYARLGNRVVMFPEHVAIFEEAIKCPTGSTSAGRYSTSTSRLTGNAFAELQARRKKTAPKESRRRPKHERGAVISMARART